MTRRRYDGNDGRRPDRRGARRDRGRPRSRGHRPSASPPSCSDRAGAASLAEGARDRPRFGRFGDGDEVVALVLEDDPPSVEIHGHGGRGGARGDPGGAGGRGASESAPNSRSNRDTIASQAEADLARAETLRTASILLDQWDGALDREIATLERLGRPGRRRSCWPTSCASGPRSG